MVAICFPRQHRGARGGDEFEGEFKSRMDVHKERECLKQLGDFCLALGGWWDLHWMGSRDDTDSGLRWVGLGLGVPRVVPGVDV